MRIALVTSHFPPSIGGVEKHVSALAREACRRGADVDVLVPGERTEVDHEACCPRARIHRFRKLIGGQDVALSPGLWRELHACDGQYHVVHTHNYHALPALAGAALVRRTPLVFTPHYHGTGHSSLRRALHVPYRAAGRAMFNRADAVICVSESEAARVSADFPAAEPKVTVIPNGVDFAALSSVTNVTVDNHQVLVAGRLERYKQVDVVVRAIASVPAPWRLRIIGDGPDRRRLERLASSLGLNRRVEFVGQISEERLNRELLSARVLVTMSQHEAFGMGVADALAAGMEIIASDIPAHRETSALLDSSGVHFLDVACSPEDLAKSIRLRCSAPRRNPVMNEALSWKTVAERTFAVYRALARLGPGRAAAWVNAP